MAEEKKWRYFVAAPSKSGVGMVFISAPERKLEDIRRVREQKLHQAPKSCIYHVAYGEKPVFVEGDRF